MLLIVCFVVKQLVERLSERWHERDKLRCYLKVNWKGLVYVIGDVGYTYRGVVKELGMWLIREQQVKGVRQGNKRKLVW